MAEWTDARLSLLLVDDDRTLCEPLGRSLRARGFDVRIAVGAREAAALARESPPELAVLGLNLADGSGRSLISTLLRSDPRTRIVVLTGVGSVAGAIEAITHGATHYLSKPANAFDDVEVSERDGADVESTMSLQRVAWEYIERVLRQHKGNISATARALSMHRRTLQRKLSKRPVSK